jgi:hypothetical protein
MSKFENLINQIRILNVQSVLSKELKQFRENYKFSYNNSKVSPENNNIIKTYENIYKFFINEEIIKKVNNEHISDKNKNIDLDNYHYRYYNKNITDVFTAMFFDLFGDISILTSIERNLWLKNIKYDILNDFINNDLYKKYSYTDFKKSELDAIFGMNKSISMNFSRVYADVCNVNYVIILLDGSIKYMNICQPKRATWLLIENVSGWYVIQKKKDTDEKYLRYEDIPNILEDYKKLNNLNNKLMLDVLQNYAKGLGIDPKKEGKTVKKNKTKDELLIEIEEKRKNIII